MRTLGVRYRSTRYDGVAESVGIPLRGLRVHILAEAGEVMDTASAVIRRIVSQWREEVGKRQARSKHDPGAEILDSCAAEIEEAIRQVDAPGAMRTVEQWARENGVTEQTVRNYIHRGELEGAVLLAHGWRIPRTARRVRRSRRQLRAVA